MLSEPKVEIFQFPAWMEALPRVGDFFTVMNIGLYEMRHRGPHLPVPSADWVDESIRMGRNPVCRTCHTEQRGGEPVNPFTGRTVTEQRLHNFAAGIGGEPAPVTSTEDLRKYLSR